MENEKEEFGTIIFDGKLTNLDKASEKELDELKKKIKEKEKEVNKKIEQLLELDDEIDEGEK